MSPGANLLAAPAPDCDVILVGDLFYEKGLAGTRFRLARGGGGRGIVTLIGDPGRSYLPRERLTKLGEYRVAGDARPRGCRDQADVGLAAEPVLLR